ncbi:endonuclease/exonuclease/phosphatase family protein [Actinomycetospora lutea]|uniref:endonuclease/exonuclease/phosphatase family protein n=1 Tax=Actinomycetospora lutea TaxID=663604 RepID=UPI002365E41E|nr:endonuclease/exonuclease/phosphatase family protein [Actinomycetospora lutea]MDD7937421.1 endonuclease/exonuclease/phosphatase family protein [Actinomycetospora lutea]
MERDAVVVVPPRPTRSSPWLWLLLAALPWAWFPLRDELALVGDVLAIVLPVLAVLAALGALVLSRRRGTWWGLPTAVSVLLAAAVAVVGPWTPQDAGTVRPGAGITVASANVTATTATLPALQASGADVLVVVENDRRIDAALAATHRYHLDAGGTPAVGVYSRFPLRLLDPPSPGFPGVRAAVDAPTPFVLYGLHVPRPWWTGGFGYQSTPAEHHRLVEALAARVAREPGPVVVAGDLNSTDRARDYRLLDADLVDAVRDGWAGPTSVTQWRAFLLRIDHLFVSRGWCGDGAHRIELPGSDHDAIAATVGPCAISPP